MKKSPALLPVLRRCSLLGAVSALAFTQTLLSAQSLPSNFSDSLVTAVSAPTATAFTPDGRLLITSQGGSLRVVKGGALLATAALAFNTTAAGSEPKICQGGEQGLLGVAVDPAFASNRYVYLYYTARNGSDCGSPNYTAANAGDGTPEGSYSAFNRKANRVSRFVLGTTGNADLVDPATEVVLVDRMPARGTNHNAGDVHFGRDGLLYVSIGDGGTDYNGASPGSGGGNDASRDKHVLTGKILRVTRTGGVPPGNPFTGVGTGVCAVTGATTAGNHCQETFAWGLRNPFRFTMDSNATGTRFFINDVGQGDREEVDESKAGADYGWYCREGTRVNSTTGKCNPMPVSMVDPIFEYSHAAAVVPGTAISGCNSITGGAFVPNGVWPAQYDNTYLLVDFICGALFSFPLGASPQPVVVAASTFASGVNSATTLAFGPSGTTQALYYTSYATGVSRIRFTLSVDVDDDGRVDAATDVLLLQRYLLGLRGAALIDGARGPGARSDADMIASSIARLGNTLDIDGDGSVKATTDGLLVLRYVLGLRGTALTTGASATTKAVDAIERDLQALLP